jgi:RecB family exonuclease
MPILFPGPETCQPPEKGVLGTFFHRIFEGIIVALSNAVAAQVVMRWNHGLALTTQG